MILQVLRTQDEGKVKEQFLKMVHKLFVGVCINIFYPYSALLVKVSSGIKKGTKIPKVELCFSSNKLTK